MSYSFSVAGATKDGLKALVAEQFTQVIKNEPCHAADEAAAIAAAGAFIDILTDVPEGHEIIVSMHGSLGWSSDAPDQYRSSGVGISAGFRQKAG